MYPDCRAWPRSMLALVSASALLVVASTAALAEGGAEACPVAVDAQQSLALATVTITSPCRRDAAQFAKIFYEDDVFLARFDASGKAQASFVLTSPHNQIKVRLAEGTAQTRTLDAPDFDKVFRITMIWQAPVRLKLIVVEPGRRLNQPGAISEDQPNLDGKSGLGKMDLAGGAPEADASGDQTTGEQSYLVPDAAAAQKRIFSRYLEFKSRGAVAQPPYCGDSPLSSVPYRIVVIENGKATTTSFQIGRAECGQPVERPVQRT